MPFVPETRQEYARLFKSYCQFVIAHMLEATRLEYPYARLVTHDQDKPKRRGDGTGITAFLVHNIARECVDVYEFSSPQHKKAAVVLEQIVFSGEVGSCSSCLLTGADAAVTFRRDPCTIWQNSAKNPFTALTVPVEETVHILLREHTERALGKIIMASGLQDPDALRQLIDDWISVEEAVAGGLVYDLPPGSLAQHCGAFDPDRLKADLAAKRRFDRYERLREGIRVVSGMGSRAAIQLYRADPRQFQKLLLLSSAGYGPRAVGIAFPIGDDRPCVHQGLK